MEIPVRWLDETPSTNGYVKEKFLSGELTAPTAIAARRQTAGRGRLGRVWESAPDQTLTLSVLVPKTLASAVTLCVGVAAVRALARTVGVEARLKWPNDILCGDRKIGGILCEGIVGERSATVLGIGINVAQTAAFFEEKGLSYGGSVLSETGKTVSVNVLAEAVTRAVGEVLETLEEGGFAPLKEEYEACCLTLGRYVNVLSPTGDGLLCGEATGVDEDGNLLVTDGEGISHAVGAGEVSVRGVYGYA